MIKKKDIKKFITDNNIEQLELIWAADNDNVFGNSSYFYIYKIDEHEEDWDYTFKLMERFYDVSKAYFIEKTNKKDYIGASGVKRRT